MFDSKCHLSLLFVLNICYLVIDGLNKHFTQLIEHEFKSLKVIRVTDLKLVVRFFKL